MANYYCKWCGSRYSHIGGLSTGSCSKNPNGRKHELYEGSEKSRYTCKYCGKESSTILTLIGSFCLRHPKGSGKGRHHPAL